MDILKWFVRWTLINEWKKVTTWKKTKCKNVFINDRK
jgi:hypothetical protein